MEMVFCKKIYLHELLQKLQREEANMFVYPSWLTNCLRMANHLYVFQENWHLPYHLFLRYLHRCTLPLTYSLKFQYQLLLPNFCLIFIPKYESHNCFVKCMALKNILDHIFWNIAIFTSDKKNFTHLYFHCQGQLKLVKVTLSLLS